MACTFVLSEVSTIHNSGKRKNAEDRTGSRRTEPVRDPAEAEAQPVGGGRYDRHQVHSRERARISTTLAPATMAAKTTITADP